MMIINEENYKQIESGLYVPAYIANSMRRIDHGTLITYKNHLRNTGKAVATIKKYCSDILSFITWLGDRYPSAGVIRQWVEEQTKRKSTVTVNSSIAALNGLFKWLGRTDCVLSFYKVQEAQYRDDMRNINDTEFTRLLAKADDRMKTILIVFRGTGIRVSELKFFNVEEVSRGHITVRNKGKTREVFIDPETQNAVLSYCRKYNICSGVIFSNRLGEALSRNYIWRCMKELAKKAGIALSKVFPHNIRHLFAVVRYKVERDIESLRLDMGHSVLSTTQKYLKETFTDHLIRVQKRRTDLIACSQ